MKGQLRAPRPSDESTALRMQKQRQKDTVCELALRSLLHARGLRYRVDCRAEPSVPRKADIVIRPAKIAVFVDGCFWHRCPLHWKPPNRHSSWWTKKVEENARRDRETTVLLKHAGWHVIRVWEHEDPRVAADEILRAVALRHPRGAELRCTSNLEAKGRGR